MNPGLRPNTSLALRFRDTKVADWMPEGEMKEVEQDREFLESKVNWDLLDIPTDKFREEGEFTREVANEILKDAFLAEELSVLCMTFFV